MIHNNKNYIYKVQNKQTNETAWFTKRNAACKHMGIHGITFDTIINKKNRRQCAEWDISIADASEVKYKDIDNV